MISVGAMLTERILTFNVSSVSRKLTAGGRNSSFRKHNMGFQSYDDLDVQSLPSLARDALKTPASSTCLSVACLPLHVLLLALSSSGGIKIRRGETYKCSSGHWKRDWKRWLVVAPGNGESKTFRVWLRWSSEWGGDRVEEGVPGTQKARRWSLKNIAN